MEKIRKVVLYGVKPSDIELLKTNPDKFWKEVDEIGSGAFILQDLDSITIPSGIVEIGESAFYRSNRLNRIDFSEGLIGIGSKAF